MLNILGNRLVIWNKWNYNIDISEILLFREQIEINKDISTTTTFIFNPYMHGVPYAVHDSFWLFLKLLLIYYAFYCKMKIKFLKDLKNNVQEDAEDEKYDQIIYY